jgi:MoaA/NifB/PqqE/SkfB family radical SAM enzyme
MLSVNKYAGARKLPIREKYMIFGAGDAGRRLAGMPISFYCFLDNNVSVSQRVNDLPVRRPSEALLEEKGRFFIIIASWDYVGEMAEQLNEIGLEYDIDYGDFRDYDFNIPVIKYLRINATYRCNSRCEMCKIWENKDGTDLPLEKMDRILSDSFFQNLEHLYITGGEPTVLPDFSLYIKNAIAVLPKLKNISVVFNGLLSEKTLTMTQKIKTMCDEKSIDLFTSVSLDGPEIENDRQRGVPGGYQKALRTIRLLRENGIHVVVSMTITKINVFALERFWAFLKRENLIAYFKPALRAKFFNNAASAPILDYTPDEEFQLKLFFRKLMEYYRDEDFAYCTAFNTFHQLSGSKRLLSCAFLNREADSLTETCNLKYCCSKSRELGDVSACSPAVVYQNGMDYLDFLKYTTCIDCNADSFGGQSDAMRELIETEEYWREYYENRHWEKLNVDLSPVGDTHGYASRRTILITGIFGEETVWDVAVLGGLAKVRAEEYDHIIVASSVPFVTDYWLKQISVNAKVIPTHDESFQYACRYSEKILVYDPHKRNYPWIQVAESFSAKIGKHVEFVEHYFKLGAEFLAGIHWTETHAAEKNIACFFDADAVSVAFALGRVRAECSDKKIMLYSVRNTPAHDGRDIFFTVRERLEGKIVFDVCDRPASISHIISAMRAAEKVYCLGDEAILLTKALNVEYQPFI